MIEADISDIDSWSIEALTDRALESLETTEEVLNIFEMIGTIALRNKGIMKPNEKEHREET